MKAYKGFNPDVTCRGFQYEEGKTYETDEATLCEKGFHACLAPLDVFSYYFPCDDNGNLNKFHEVELEEVDEKRDNDTKVCAKKIKIGAELNFFGLAKAHIEYVKEHVDKEKVEEADGDRSAATNTGDQSAATNTGEGSGRQTRERGARRQTRERGARRQTRERGARRQTREIRARRQTREIRARRPPKGKKASPLLGVLTAKQKRLSVPT